MRTSGCTRVVMVLSDLKRFLAQVADGGKVVVDGHVVGPFRDPAPNRTSAPPPSTAAEQQLNALPEAGLHAHITTDRGRE